MLLIQEMEKRGIFCKEIGQTQIIEAQFNDHKELILEMCNRLIPAQLHFILNHKFVLKQFMQTTPFMVPDGACFSCLRSSIGIKLYFK